MAPRAKLRGWHSGLLLLGLGPVWLLSLHLVFKPDRTALVEGLLTRLVSYWTAPGAEQAQLRRVNPEWDLMSRTFSVLSFTNLALARPLRRAELLGVTDALLEDTLRLEAERADAFVLPYFHAAPFRDPQAKSLFVDGELALMLAARQTVAREPKWDEPLRERVDRIADQLERGPVASGESYPDEGWTFCNTIALAALTLSDRLDGRDHSALRRRWVAVAQDRLVEPKTGLFVSSFTWSGRPLDGPEGSSLWLSLHMLELVEPELARAQYQRAREALGHAALGFAWAGEWPSATTGGEDVDSGPTIPLVGANAGSSGLAVLGAAAFHDDDFLDALLTSLAFAGFPRREGEALRFSAGNVLGDAVIFYALVQGPLWAKAHQPPGATEARR